ncbi:hypothetical protein M406DRAFT_67522 [Cryphonectria parasitica EP155]|uniref:TeaA receptor TeaR n=1 Tax=Cryphonectria parasitica (strain ATCC 38755 / EP155) TaxID=660469 RepID=A0A9P4YCY5_CRYP1|nr:uncharacterized protein M406DRAFT_67522 [Cryphonectria parasitica EP155]KAF3771202.1 hypothetical protein M406DRAFT_67522 [Cryphonectria parasitica EP155]
MAAMSTAQTATTLTPPSSSHGDANGFRWDFATDPAGRPDVSFPLGLGQLHEHDDGSTSLKRGKANVCVRVQFLQERHYEEKASLKGTGPNGNTRPTLAAQNGNSASFGSAMSVKTANGEEAVNRQFSHAHSNEDTPDTMADGPMDYDDDDDDRYVRTADGYVYSSKRPNNGMEWSDEDSKWIHRDKLVKIENEELQAAGIILPPPRSRSKGPRRDRSQSSHRKMGNDGTTRSRKNSSHVFESGMNEESGDGDAPSRPMTGSRIPVPKKSPAFAHSRENSVEEHDKDKRPDGTTSTRSRSNSTTLKGLEPSPTFKSTPPKKAATEPPTKKTTPAGGARKPSGPSKSIPPEARGRPKPKGKNGANGSNGRPNTRSGERELSVSSSGPKQMEGEPPWMVSAYKPDPRLPPDQQLLPTVAKRLAQEKWEQEGKFGNVYDKDFRPLTDEGFLAPPLASSSPAIQPTSSTDNIVEQQVEKPDEWPLRSADAPKSPASIGRSSTYSTMPRIQDKPPSHSPLASPREPQQPLPSQPTQQPAPSKPTQITRVPDVEKAEEGTEAEKKGGCGCCIVM